MCDGVLAHRAWRRGHKDSCAQRQTAEFWNPYIVFYKSKNFSSFLLNRDGQITS
jgi:hypothetical protein